MLSENEEVEMIVASGTIMWLLSQRGHWLLYFLPAKFKMVRIAVALILLFSCLFFLHFFFRIQFLATNLSYFFSLSKYFVLGGQTEIFLASRPFIEHVQRIPLIKKITFFSSIIV